MNKPRRRDWRHLGELFASGGYDAVRREWAAWIEGFARTRGFVTSTELALLHASLGDRDRPPYPEVTLLGRAVVGS